MTDLILAAILFGVAVAVSQVLRVVRRRWAKHEQYPFLATELGLARESDRFLLDTRVTRYVGTCGAREVEVEVGCGAQGVYVRLEFPFAHPVDLGVRVSLEVDDNVVTRVMRMREMEVGHEAFDSQFILLSRSEERLKEVLDEPTRAALAALRAGVRDLRLDEGGLHLLVTAAVDDEALGRLVDEGARVTQLVFERAETLAAERRQRDESLVLSGLDIPTGVHDTLPNAPSSEAAP